MIDIKDWPNNYDGWIGIKKYGFDIDDMNANIRDYRPIGTKVEFWNGYASVLIEDRNGMVPSFWMDYSIEGGDLIGDWNQYIFYLTDPSDVEKKIYMDDTEDIFEPAESEGCDFLIRNGYVESPRIGPMRWTAKADMESGDIIYRGSKNRKSNRRKPLFGGKRRR